MNNVFVATLALTLLTACGSPTRTNPDMATTDRNGANVTGNVGANWSDEELRSNAFGIVCAQGETVTNLAVRRNEDGSGAFSATCV